MVLSELVDKSLQQWCSVWYLYSFHNIDQVAQVNFLVVRFERHLWSLLEDECCKSFQCGWSEEDYRAFQVWRKYVQRWEIGLPMIDLLVEEEVGNGLEFTKWNQTNQSQDQLKIRSFTPKIWGWVVYGVTMRYESELAIIRLFDCISTMDLWYKFCEWVSEAVRLSVYMLTHPLSHKLLEMK